MAFLQPLTHRFPAIVRDPLVAFIGQECYTTLVWNTDFTDEDCVRLSVSKVLGLGIVAGGSIVKVPQIVKIVGGRSARGLSLSSYLLDTVALGITVAYNVRHGFSWSTYGESVFLLAQNVVITFLIVAFSSASSRPVLLVGFAALFGLSAFLLSSPLTTHSTLQLLAAACIPLSLASKLPQIVSNFRAGSTGQLSAFLVFNSLAGCLARVYTTSTETKDDVLWWGFFLGAVLNGVLALQMAWYWNAKEPKLASKRPSTGIAEFKPAVKEEPVSPAVAAAKSPARPSSPLSGRKYVRKLD